MAQPNQVDFFRVPGQITKHISHGGNAVGVHALFGSHTSWGSFPAAVLFSTISNWGEREGGPAALFCRRGTYRHRTFKVLFLLVPKTVLGSPSIRLS